MSSSSSSSSSSSLPSQTTTDQTVNIGVSSLNASDGGQIDNEVVMDIQGPMPCPPVFGGSLVTFQQWRGRFEPEGTGITPVQEKQSVSLQDYKEQFDGVADFQKWMIEFDARTTTSSANLDMGELEMKYNNQLQENKDTKDANISGGGEDCCCFCFLSCLCECLDECSD